MFFPDVGLAPLLLALQALGTLDARLSPRVTGSTPSHPYCDTYAPAERRAHQCMAEQVSARCTHCMSPRRRSKASTVASSVGSLYSLFFVLPSLHRSLFRGPGVRWRGWRSRSLGCRRSVTEAKPRLVEQPSRDNTTCTRSASS